MLKFPRRRHCHARVVIAGRATNPTSEFLLKGVSISAAADMAISVAAGAQNRDHDLAQLERVHAARRQCDGAVGLALGPGDERVQKRDLH